MKVFEELRLTPGVTIKLSVSGNSSQSYTLETVYIGSLALHSVIVAMPSQHRDINWRGGMNVAVTVVMATGVATFSSRILAIGERPYSYIHLVYPESVNFCEMRGAARIKVELAAQIASKSTDVATNARVLDISVSGLKLATDTNIGKVGDELKVHVAMQLAGIERSLSMSGVIRARLASDGDDSDFVNIYGVQFCALEDEQRILLHAFVLNGLQAADSVVEI